MTKVLIIAAHPDDEVLGCGGTIARHADAGDCVQVLIAAQGVNSRYGLDDHEQACHERSALIQAANRAGEILGTHGVEFLELPDNRLDSLDRLDLIKLVEDRITFHQPQVVYVHHAGDVNVDHRRLHEAVVTACRPTPSQGVRKLLSYEVASSTEWQPPGSAQIFQPNFFVDISAQLIRKLSALAAYASEMREWPHARSLKAIEHHSCWRGSQVGLESAEAFCLLRHIM